MLLFSGFVGQSQKPSLSEGFVDFLLKPLEVIGSPKLHSGNPRQNNAFLRSRCNLSVFRNAFDPLKITNLLDSDIV